MFRVGNGKRSTQYGTRNSQLPVDFALTEFIRHGNRSLKEVLVRVIGVIKVSGASKMIVYHTHLCCNLERFRLCPFV